jgi:hypothetical protein
MIPVTIIKEVRTIVRTDPGDFDDAVNEAIQDNFQPHGDMQVKGGDFVQLMAKIDIKIIGEQRSKVALPPSAFGR